MPAFLEHELKEFVAQESDIKGKVPVAEIFPAFQGEGMLVGQPTLFLRLGLCNDRCVWCDSKYAVLPKYSKLWVRMSPTDVVRGLQAANERIKHITLTGGNPAIHKPFSAHLSYLQDIFGYTVAIETQGNIYPEWGKNIDQVTLSPKGPSSGNITDVDSEAFHSWVDERELSILKMIDEKEPEKFKITDEVAYDNLCIKIVIFNEEDYAYAKEVHQKFPNVPLYLQPGTEQGVDDPTEQIIRGTLWLESWIALDRAFDLAKVRIIPQMHVLLHGVKRGV